MTKKHNVLTRFDGDDLITFTIISQDADGFMARLHDRMPFVLTREPEAAWLDPTLTTPQEVLDLLSRNAGVALDAYPVSRLVNTPGHDSQALIQPVALGAWGSRPCLEALLCLPVLPQTPRNAYAYHRTYTRLTNESSV